MRSSYSAPEAPTHLRAGDLPPGLLDHLDQRDQRIDPIEANRDRSSSRSAPRSSSSRSSSRSASVSRTRRRTESAAAYELPHIPDVDDHSIVSVSRSVSAFAVAPRVRTEPASATPAGRRPRATPRDGSPRPEPQPARGSSPAQAAPQVLPSHATATPQLRRPSVAPLPPPPDAPAPLPPPPAVAVPLPPPPVAPSYAAAANLAAAAAAAVAAAGYALPPPPAGYAAAPPAAPPPAAPGAIPELAAFAGAAGVGAVDPMAIPTPPELAGPIYGHIRRLALQADLPGADRVLRDALAELTSSLSCSIVYPGQDGLWTLGEDDEIPRDPTPLVSVANARRAIVSGHRAIIPVITSSETVAVITLTRNARQPAYQLIEQIAMVALARDAAPILHHLAVAHLQKQREIQADKGSLYRGEALEAHRTRGQEGQLIQLSPAWVKRAYPVLVIALIVASVFAVFVKVPTYSTGTALIMFEGSTSVTATASGTVGRVFVKANEAVKKGDPLVELASPEAAAALTQAETEWKDQQVQFLFDQTDEQVRKSLKTAATGRDHALALVEARTIRAPRDGVVTNLHVKEGVPLQLGGYVMQITDENSEIEVLGFLPSKDSPRIRTKMGMQLELDGYKKARVIGEITQVQSDAVAGNEASKIAGEILAETIAKDLQAGTTWVTVRARLPSRTFKTERSTYRYHHGMHATVEIKIQSKPFLATLLPAVEKYLPD